MSDPKPAALNFNELSLTEFGGIETAELGKLVEYFGERYKAVCVDEILPYLVIWCKENVPEFSERPRMIAGLVTIWLVHGKDMYPKVSCFSFCIYRGSLY
jgi:hypothetical protein